MQGVFRATCATQTPALLPTGWMQVVAPVQAKIGFAGMGHAAGLANGCQLRQFAPQSLRVHLRPSPASQSAAFTSLRSHVVPSYGAKGLARLISWLPTQTRFETAVGVRIAGTRQRLHGSRRGRISADATCCALRSLAKRARALG